MIPKPKGYADLKESGSPELGPVPRHWKIVSLGSLVQARTQRGRPDLPLLSVVREKGVILRSSMSDDENHNFIPDDLTNYKVVLQGDLVVNKMKAWQGSVGIAPCDGIVSPAYFVFQLSIENSRYGHALLRSKPYVSFFARVSDGVRIGQWDLSIAGLRRIPVALPPRAEQDAIVRFLNYAERQIQRYIRTKRKLIALLDEQKRAIIQRAVSRGIDPSVDLKPSGLEWLGEIPEHWAVLPLKRIASVRGGYAFPSTLFGDAGVPVVRMNNLRRGRLSLDDVACVPPNAAVPRFALNAGDILFGLSGSVGPTGSLGNYAIVEQEQLPLQLNQRVARFELKPNRLLPGFLTFLIQTPEFARQVLARTTGTAQFNVSTDDIGSIKVALPPLSEQTEIASHLRVVTETTDEYINLIEREVELHREWRSALITDIVTGKHDVRAVSTQLPFEENNTARLDESGPLFEEAGAAEQAEAYVEEPVA